MEDEQESEANSTILGLMERMTKSTEAAVAHSVRVEELLIKNHRSRRMEFFIQVSAAAAIFFVVLILGFQFREGQERSAQGRQLLQQNTEVLNTIRDCTVEGGKCREENKRQLSTLLNYQYALAVCGKRNSTEEQFKECVKAATPSN